MNVTLDNLDFYLNEVKRLLGRDFIEKIDSLNTIGLPRDKAFLIECKSHPFAQFLQTFKTNIEASKKNGYLVLSNDSHMLLNLISHLKAIECLPNAERIIENIKEKSTFYSAIFEAYVAFAYHSKGYEIEIVKERPDISRKTCDLKIKAGEKIIYIECKSLEDFSIKETREWKELLWRLHNALDKFKRNWRIDIYACKQINQQDSNLIYSECLMNIRNNDLRERKVVGGNFLIQFAKITEFDQVIKGSWKSKIDSNIQFSSPQISTRTLENGKVIGKNPKIINVSSYFEKNISPRLISEFKTARKQIPHEGPGIIHYAIPYKQETKLLEIIDKSYNRMYKKLNRDTKRINAVVISGIRIDKKSQNPISFLHYIIPNLDTRSELPPNFSILGANDRSIE